MSARLTSILFVKAPSPSGKAEVCKTSTPGSNPGGASNINRGVPPPVTRLPYVGPFAHSAPARGAVGFEFFESSVADARRRPRA